jgi:phosphatidylserine decarboxylase
MAIDIKKFVNQSKKLKSLGRDEIDHEEFFRDPARPNYIDSDYFYSPADGIILYQKEVTPTEKILDIKGKNFNLRELLEDKEFKPKCMVVGIFMTEFDVHINRVPYAGILKYRELEPLSTVNLPMLATQNKILKGVVDQSAPEYIKRNQRMLNTIYSPMLNMKYYVVQIADEDINLICPFNTNQNVRYNQNVRFSMVRWGSQVDLIVPIHKDYDFEFVQKEKKHVEGGIDKLIKIIRKKEVV